MKTLALLLTTSIALAPLQDSLAVALQTIYRQHLATRSDRNVATLVKLDTELRHLIIDPWEKDDWLVDKEYFKPEYDSLGIYVGHFSDALDYSGKLLDIAHRINPRSPYRSYTLYSTVNAQGFPDVVAAKVYLKEFPTGPYAFEVARVLAFFYDDLFKSLRDKIAGKSSFYDIYDDFMTSAPLKQQMKTAKQNGLRYYRMALAIRPKAHGLNHDLKTLEHGTGNGWFLIND